MHFLPVGIITKVGIDRLEARNVQLAFDCPNCGSARITIKSNNGSGMQDVQCHKCDVNIILDCLNLTVINERAPKG